MKRKLTHLALTAAAAAVLSGSAYAASIGADFIGRSGGDIVLQPSETAGVVPQAFWNPISDSTTTPQFNGVSAPLLDNTGAATAVQLVFAANDSWNSDGPIVTPNDKMMKGIIKRGGGAGAVGTSITLAFTNVPAGTYDLYVYGVENGGPNDLDVRVGTTTKYWTEPAAFDGTFVESTATTADGRTQGNYVKFTGVSPTASAVTVVATYQGNGSDGLGIAGMQLVSSGAFPASTAPVALTTMPAAQTKNVGGTVTFTAAGTGGGTYQWFKNGVAVAGKLTETGSSYTTPALTIGDNGAKYKVTFGSGANTVTSPEVTLTVVENLAEIFALGAVKVEIFTGITGTPVENLLTADKYLNNQPDSVFYLNGLDLPGQGINDFGARLTGSFIPSVTGDYTFFIRSDDASQLQISTDATEANLQPPLAEEFGCCNPFMEPDTGDTATSASPIRLVAGTRYAFQALMKEGGGGDFFQAAWRLATDTTPASTLRPISGANVGATVNPTGAAVTIGTNPSDATATAGRQVTFTVGASASSLVVASPPLNYQWKKNGVAIPGATGASYTTPDLAVADNNAKFSVDVFSLGQTKTSTEATLTVSSDAVGPKLMTAASLKGSTFIGICFDERLDRTTAETAANYTVAGATVTAAKLQSDTSKVELTLGAALTGTSFSVEVKNVKDVPGNTITTASVTGTVINLTSQDIGTPDGAGGFTDPIMPGHTFTCAPGAFDVTAGGTDIWNNADGFHYVWEEKTGNFDVKVRMHSVVSVNQWSAGALMIRETLDAGSRQWHIKQTPRDQPAVDGSGTGASGLENNRRRTTDGATDNLITVANPNYPNAWIRISRVGDQFTTYRSDDGITWTQVGTEIPPDADGNPAPYPPKVFVGLASTSHNNTEGPQYYTTVVYTDYGDYVSAPPRSTITVSRTGANLSIAWTPAVGRLQRATALAGAATVWTDAGTTSPVAVTIPATGNAFYRVVNP